MLALLITTTLSAQNEFITTWKTDNTGSTNSTSIRIPMNDTQTYDFDIDWENDGVFDDLGVTGSITHDYGTAGEYQIAIRGTFPAISFNNEGDIEKLISIDQWGTISWQTMEKAFYGCKNMIYNATDVPDLSNVSDMSYMFSECESFNGNIGNWDVSTITSFNAMFEEAIVFNQNLSAWNVENAQDMTAMFYHAESFDQDISSWKVDNVTTMKQMFGGAFTFNQDINIWNVSNVTDMTGMFHQAYSFNGDISNWNVGNVTIMKEMFQSADAFNIDISNWDVSKVTSMTRMFSGANEFNQNIGKWNTASLTTLNQCFTVAGSFDQDISRWNIANVTNMGSFLDGTAMSTSNYDKLLQSWSAQSVQLNVNFGAMGKKYCHSESYREILITNYGWTFTDGGRDNDSDNYFITGWITNNVGTSGDTEIGISTNSSLTYNYDVDWDNDGVFDDLNVTGDITHDYGVAGAQTIQIRGIFPGIYFNNGGDKEKLISIDQWGTIWWETMESAFNGCSNMLCNASDAPDVSYVSNMNEAFQSAALFDLNPGSWNVSELTTAENVFNGSGLSNQNYDNLLSGWGAQTVQPGVSLGTINNSYCSGTYGRSVLTDTYGWSVTDLGESCDETNYFITTWKTDNTGTSDDLSIIIPTNDDYEYFYDVDWDNDGVFDTFGITGNYEHTFESVGTYTIQIRGTFPAIYFNDNDDKDKLISIDQWGTIQWQSMESSFKGCSNLNITALDAPDLSEVTTMEESFQYCTSLNASLNNWDVSNIIIMYELFEEATSFNGDISSWDVSSLIIMGDMFEGATAFNQDLSSWDVSSVELMSDVFKQATSFNGDVSSWDVSAVTNMGEMFEGATSFNQDISGWDVSNVSDMTDLLDLTAMSTQNYDKLLKAWSEQDVKSNINFGAEGIAYCNAGHYRDALSTNHGWSFVDNGQACNEADYFITTWETDNSGSSGSTEIAIITNSSYSYNYDVDWDNDGTFDEFGLTGHVIHDFETTGTYTIRIRGAFPSIYFNNSGDKGKLASIDQWGSITWESFASAFAGCSNLIIDAADAPDLSFVTDMSYAFMGCNISSHNLSHWDVSNVTNMSNMFMSAAVPLGIGSWNVGNVTNMANMFSSAYPINPHLSDWNVGKVTNFEYMFSDTDEEIDELSSWDVSSGIEFTSMFESASNFNQDLSNWNVSNATNMAHIFSNSGLSTLNYDKILNSWANQLINNNVQLGASGINFCQSKHAKEVLENTYNWIISDGGQVCEATDYFIITCRTDNPGTSGDTEITIPTNSSYTYYYDVDWDNDGVFDEFGLTTEVTHNYGTSGTYTIGIRGNYPAPYFNESGDYLKLISIDQWGSVLWESMNSAFEGCSNATLNATDIPDLSQVSTIKWMFESFGDFNVDISNWDVSNVTNMEGLFARGSFNGNISDWDVSNVTDFSQLFQENEVFNQDLSSWNTSKADDMNSMFSKATAFNQDLSSWDVSQVLDMMQMFQGATSFDQNLGDWDITNIYHSAYMYDMLVDTRLSTTNYDATLEGWASQLVRENINLGTVSASYCEASEARETLINNYGWIINDYGLETEAPIPNEVTLDDILAECQVTSLTAPTASDCTGTITGTHNLSLPITAQGTTVVTWTFDDGNGNTSVQTQNVVIEDVSKPEISCVEDVVVAANYGTSYIVPDAEFDLSSYSDNCEIDYISNSINGAETLEGEELFFGDNLITWTVSDKAGNIETCSSTVTVTVTTNNEEVLLGNAMKVFPNPTSGVATVKYNSNEHYILNILNSAGVIVEKYSVNKKQYQLDISHLKNGIYLVQVVTENKVYTTKLVKK